MHLSCNSANSFYSPPIMQTAFRRKLRSAGFLVPSCPKHALVWGTAVRGFARRDLC